jgi:hypothetical protein
VTFARLNFRNEKGPDGPLSDTLDSGAKMGTFIFACPSFSFPAVPDKETAGPENLVAGAGFEPATFGL